MPRSALALAAPLLILLLAAPASADIPPPAVSACSGKKVGDECKVRFGGAGVCQDRTCSRSRPGPGGKIHTRTYACVKCVAKDKLKDGDQKDGDKKDGDQKDGDKKDGDSKDGNKKKSDAGLGGGLGMGLGGLALGAGVFGAWAMRRREDQ